MQYSAEYTDTFGDQANYCWVLRATFDAPADASDDDLIVAAEIALDVTLLNGFKRETMGDILAVYPHGECTVLFIEPTCEEDEHRMAGRV